MSLARRSAVNALACAAVLAAASSAGAATTVYSTTFPEATGTLPTNWSLIVGGGPSDPGWHIDANGDYVYNGGLNGSSVYNGLFSNGNAATTLRNQYVAATFDRTGTGLVGVVARSLTASETFYNARIIGTNQLQVFRFGGGTTQLGSTVILPETKDAGETWRIEMSVFGGVTATHVTATVYNQLGQQVGSISANDTSTSTLSTGTAGVRTQPTGIFKSFSIDTPDRITTSTGSGADTYVEFRNNGGNASNNTNVNHGADTNIQIKSANESPTSQLYRKAYFRFDLSSIGKGHFVNAAFDLTSQGSDSAGVNFQVWGLNDGDAGENWVEGNGGTDNSPLNEITWANAPGNAAANSIDAGRATLLGTMRGAGSTSTTWFSSTAFVDFLNADTDDLVTLIVIADLTSASFGSTTFLFNTKESGGTAPGLSFILVPTPAALPAGLGLIGLLSVRRRRRA